MPNEYLDQHTKWAELQIKATEILGKYTKDIADARKIDAQALAEEIKDEALKNLEKQLDRDLNRLNRHRRQIELKQKEIENNWQKIIPIQTGYKPYDLPSLYIIHEALSRFLANLDTSQMIAFVSTSIPDKVRHQDNFVIIGKTSELKEVPETIENLGALLEWAKENGLFFKKFNAAHMFVLTAFNQLNIVMISKIKVLEESLNKLSAEDLKSIDHIRNAMDFKSEEKED